MDVGGSHADPVVRDARRKFSSALESNVLDYLHYGVPGPPAHEAWRRLAVHAAGTCAWCMSHVRMNTAAAAAHAARTPRPHSRLLRWPSCYAAPAVLEGCVNTIEKIFANVLDNEGEEKFRKVRADRPVRP